MLEPDPVDPAPELEVGLVSEAVVIGNPNWSVVAGGKVVISGVGSVISVVATSLVSAQKQFGVFVGMKSPTVLSPKLALVYVTRNGTALSVFVAARLASGVGDP